MAGKDYSLQRLDSYKNKIDNAMLVAKTLPEEAQSLMACYICIMVSGFIENLIKTQFTIYIEKKSNSSIQMYVQNSYAQITNLKVEKIVDYLNKFDTNWGNNFITEVTQEEKDSINSIIANRNNIAHGQPVGLSYCTILKYYNDILKVKGKLEKIINPGGSHT